MKRISTFLMLALPLIFAVGVLASFKNITQERVTGNGNVKEESRDASSFKDISTSGIYKVVITQGNNHSIRIEAEENLLPYIITEIKGDELRIYSKKGYNIQPTKGVKVYVTLQQVDKLSASGAGGYSNTGVLNSDRIQLQFSGAADANLNIKTKKLDVGLSGASNIKLKGSSDKAEYGISGAADIQALDLSSDDVSVDISGTGKAQVFAQKKLAASISGMGSIKYKGDPGVTKSISGMGRISKI
ncbi:MAG: DUF2807 domain-containing protein [Chitinophaga sp.]|uniref:head GIN domain-containing protein n=1 Tax=Chitinophaga sp. TaxID=1869181 RepID=UPI001B097DE6|nr:head GIN domain-containing protein [Chitinophaga sp.]MBO9728210.1 DUF2807 domain-containing protein [Chitinophaga sp.]